MYLQNIKLINFKNYREVNISFSDKLNLITGVNGSGKTNLLDSIFYLSSGRSALNSVDYQNINHEEDAFHIGGTFLKEEKKYSVNCQLQKGQKKNILVNQKKIDKISEFIGSFPSVLITPDDNEIIKEGSEIRRSFFDNIFAQTDKNYLTSLIEYSKALKIRNSLLKQFAEKFFFDAYLLEPYNNILVQKGEEISHLREKYIIDFLPYFTHYYNFLTDNAEEVHLKYKSSVQAEGMLAQLEKNLPEDRILQRTTVGVHKDDFIFTIGNHPLKKFGSQGQQKSFLISLKLSHFKFLKQLKGFSPILLLDDIFDKLDENRIVRLLETVLQDSFGQVFITDARPATSISFFGALDHAKKTFTVKENLIKEL